MLNPGVIRIDEMSAVSCRRPSQLHGVAILLDVGESSIVGLHSYHAGRVLDQTDQGGALFKTVKVHVPGVMERISCATGRIRMFVETDTVLALSDGSVLYRTVDPTALDRLRVAILVPVQGTLDPDCKAGTGGRMTVTVLTTDEVLQLVRGIDLAIYPFALIRILKDMPSTGTNEPVAIFYWKGLVPVVNHRKEYRRRHW
jgi:hypothetical protein